jgi:carboxypeptidase C (cathepsin A)
LNRPEAIDKTKFAIYSPPMRNRIVPLLCCLSLQAFGASEAQEAKPDVKSEVAEATILPKPVSKESSVMIDGQKIPYRVTSGKLQLQGDDGKPLAAVFHVSYMRSDMKDASKRPVMFAFNGGPGSSAVWLHIGVLGPKILSLPGDGTQPPTPPVRVVDNPLSILDVCDLVFVDPVTTGYSRAAKDVKPADFHGLDEDVKSLGDFIRRWITENKRWSSPKYLLGESYGGIRVAALSQHLQSRYGMSLNGVVLLSSLLDFSTLQSSQGNDLANLVFLPAFTGTAHYHRKIQGDRDALVRESAAFAFGDYAAALLKGNDLADDARREIADRLAGFTGIPAERWIKNRLRVDPSLFRAELLRAEGKTLGRFDARVAWDAADVTSEYPEYDPSYALAYGAFSTALLDYMSAELGYHEDQPYEILTGKVQPWNWGPSNSVTNVSDRLATAMRDNPRLRVLVMGGYTDLATPPEGVAHSVRHMLHLSSALRSNISTVFYEGGHMFYLNPPDLVKTRKDLLEFLKSANP